MRLHGHLAEADALAHDDHQRQTSGASIDVHCRTTGEVEDAEIGEPSGTRTTKVGVAEVEDPVSDREIDDRHPYRGEDSPCEELHAIGNRARDERHRDDGEHELEHAERKRGDRVVAAIVSELAGKLPEPGERETAHEAVPVVAEGNGVAEGHPEDSHDAERKERHHHHVEHALDAHHSAVEERHSGRHEQHQCRGGQHPGGISRAEVHRSSLLLIDFT